jgi:putative ABC transport system substrate-binding protein
MDRRTCVSALVGALLTLPFAVEAQEARKLQRIGYLVQNTAEVGRPQLAAFREGLRERGWVEGRNILIEVRFAEGNVDQLPKLVAELIGLKADIIVTGSSAATWAAKNATQSIPIVMAASVNATGEGLVTSLAAHPGGNITGMTSPGGPRSRQTTATA